MEKVPSYDLTQIDPVINTAYKAIKDAIKYQEEHGGIPTLFHKHKLDRITSEWQDSDLIIIAARPAMGKTAFALSMARNLAINQRFPIAFFSLELRKEQLIYRLISNVCEIEVDNMLLLFENICYQAHNGIIQDNAFGCFEYQIRATLDEEQIQNYLADLGRYCSKRGGGFPFVELLLQGVRMESVSSFYSDVLRILNKS